MVDPAPDLDRARRPAWTIHTDVFEGPLDLLLHLVQREGIDLATLEVAAICDAYLEALDRLRELRLNLAADYLVMAATLVHLKSLSLLPRPPSPATDDGEPDDDPAEALRRQLAEYQRHKRAAEELKARPWLGRDTFARDADALPPTDRPVATAVDAFGLLDLYYGLITREAPEPPTFDLPDDGPDLAACCTAVLDHLTRAGGRSSLDVVLRALRTRAERVIAFLAVLEMARLQWVDLTQPAHLAPVQVAFRDGAEPDLAVLTGQLVVDEEGEAGEDEVPSGFAG